MGALCTRYGDCLERTFAKTDDSLSDVKLKRLISSACIAIVGLAGAALGPAGISKAWDTYTAGLLLCLCSCALCLSLFRFTHMTPRSVGQIIMPLFVLLILMMDWTSARVLSNRQWVYIIIVLDMSIVLDINHSFQLGMLATYLSYLAVERAESVARFGLYEASEWKGHREMLACNCADPPCENTLSAAALAVFGFTLILGTDFHLTRGFHVALRRQMALVDTSASVAERVAALLAAYSIQEARVVVDQEGERLPPALLDAFEQLFENLDSYRPFLPDSVLFKNEEQSVDGDSTQSGSSWALPGSPRAQGKIPPPGVTPGGSGSSEVALVFTDIQSSTELWEMHPQGMYEGLHIHNALMRTLAGQCSGYEVKTIGDAFMLAFRSAEDACRFGVEAQQQLLRQRWPADLTAHHLCSRVDAADGEALWYGLRVRAGIHWGEVRVERSPITGRCDYFGPTVNVAARIEAVVQKGGLVGITDVVLDCLSPDVLSRLGEPALHALGARDLKGVRESMSVTIMLPQRLLPRIGVLEESARGSAAERGTETGEQEGALDSPRGVTRFASVTAAVRQGARRSLKMSQRWSFTSRRSARSSDHACATDRQVSANPQQRQSLSNVALRLRQMVGSCAVARANLWTADPLELRLSALICSIESAADRSEGVLGSVLSACAIVTWNAARHCPDSVLSCQQFLGLAAREKRSVRTHFGVTTGGMLSGNIATARRRFATVVGGCIELAAALAEEAELCGDNTLAAGPVATLSANEGNAHRAQLWICAPVPPATQQTSPRFAAFAMTPVPQLARLPLQLDVGSSVQSSCVLPQESPLETEILTDSAAPSPVREHAARDLVVWSVVPQNVSAGRWDRVLLAPEARGDSGLLQARIDLAFRAAAAAADEHAAMEALRPLGEDGAHLVQRVQRGALRTRRFVEVWDPDGSPSARRASA